MRSTMMRMPHMIRQKTLPTFAAAAVLAVLNVPAAFGQNAEQGTTQPAAPAASAPAPDSGVHEAECYGPPYSIYLTVRNVQESEGLITVDVHGDDPEKFLKSGAKLARIRVPAVKGDTQFCIAFPEAGVYALAIYHDRNANMKLDKTWIGLPDEPFGLSNNPPKRLAMPRHRESAFTVDGPRLPTMIILSD